MNRNYRHRHRRHQHGYLLLPVVITLALLASISYLLSHDSALHLAGSRGEAERLEARYVAEAGLNHANWQAQQANCSGYPSLGNQAFGNHSYSTVISPTGGSPVSITASALLANGSRYSISRDAVDTYESPITHTLVLGTDPGADVLIDKFYQNQNYGNYELQLSALLSWTRRSLLTFDLSALPGGIRLIGAELQLYQLNTLSLVGDLTAHRVTRSWVEGTGQGTGSPNGATWNTHNGSNGWSSPGGDHQATAIASATARLTPGWVGWNIGAQVERWLDGTEANQGLLLKTGLTSAARFASKEHNDASLRPRLVLTYACPCDAGAAGTSLVLQPDAAGGADTYLDDGNPGTNWGAETQMRISNKANSQKRGLLNFDLSGIPTAALITSATLELNLEGIGSGDIATIYLHRVTRDWHQAQTNWNLARNSANWASPGGDIDPTATASAVVDSAAPGATQWDITALVGDWVAGTLDNHGLMLQGSPGVNHADFSTSNHTAAALRPKLTVQYHCPCGAQCTAPEPEQCSADFVPNTTTQKFDASGLDSHYTGGITAVPGGMTFNGTIQLAADGGWIAVGGNGSVVLLDRAGNRLDRVNVGADAFNGVTYVPQGVEAGKLVAVRGNTAMLIDPAEPIAGATHPTFSLGSGRDLRGASYIKGGSYDGALAFVDSATMQLLITDQAFNLRHSVNLMVMVGEFGILATNYQAMTHLPDTDKFLVLDAGSQRGYIFDSNGNHLSDYSVFDFGISKPTAAAIDPDSCAHLIGSQAENHYLALSGNPGSVSRTLGPAADTTLFSGSPNENAGSAPGLKVGQNNASEFFTALLSVDLGELPAGARVDSARLRLYAGRRTGNKNNWLVELHRIEESWTEHGATWLRSDGSHDWRRGPGGSYDPTVVASLPVADTGWYEFDVTPLVQEWLDGASPNHGMQIISDAPKRDGLEFHSREDAHAPQLVVVYGT